MTGPIQDIHNQIVELEAIRRGLTLALKNFPMSDREKKHLAGLILDAEGDIAVLKQKVKFIKEQRGSKKKEVGPGKTKANVAVSKVQNKPKKLVLHSRRGVRKDEETLCDNCKRLKKPVFSYKESSNGEVNICSECKPKLFDRSFGKKDALEFATTGGHFEGNRSKH
ncbi:MAG: hypothetical protein GY774_13395 [Planctomycetes bacterium]|nr:hypothetical protein [Planctomycetota bacterium]